MSLTSTAIRVVKHQYISALTALAEGHSVALFTVARSLFEEREASHISLQADVTFLPIVLLRKIIHIYCNAACIDPKDVTWKVCFEIIWHLLEFVNSEEMDRSLLHLNFEIYGLHLWKATRYVCT